ncbi:MAG TPA: DUF4157 domain-containing protein [Kofleriaceae bacterium]|nr:DUF4157 domain-containing protein [Kofleriaceae bacterium]
MTLTSQLAEAPVQRKANDGTATGGVHGAAAHGIGGAATAMPHGDSIQRAFGRHSIGHVQAHVGGAAAEGAEAMGADAFATGDHVAFARQPDLHTAAHEAAHVVQQRAGVQLHGGVGEVGDVHEQHADEVADLVVQGKSAEAALDRYAGPGAASAGGAVQRHAFVAGKQIKKSDKIATGDAAGFVTDEVVRSYKTNDELKKHASHQTDYLGNLPDGTWMRFHPTGLNVLGEMHTLVRLRTVVNAVGTTNFIDERLSNDDLAPGSHMAAAYETENAETFKDFGIENEPDKKQFGAEALLPKIGYAMNAALPYFIGPKKISDLTEASAQYVGQPVQRYLKIGWGYGKDIRAKVAAMQRARQTVPPKMAELARVVTLCERELDGFITKLPVDGFLGDALGPDHYPLLPPLAIVASALVDASVEEAIGDPSSRMDDAQKKKFAGTTTGEDKGKLLSNWRNFKFEDSVKAAAGRGVRYAGMGLAHLQHLKDVGLPSNAHAYDMVDVDLTRFEEETARLKAIAVPQ